MYQSHPPNPNGKLLRRFYEPLVLLEALDCTRGPQRPDLVLDRDVGDASKLWHNFLDCLSLLCDYRKGGDTVTGIAVQSTPERPVFWLASNSNLGSKSAKLLVWILERLDTAHDKNGDEVADLEAEIRAHCIDFNFARIKTYTRWFLKKIRVAKRHMSNSDNSQDAILRQAFIEVEDIATDPHRLCALVYDLRRHESVSILRSRHNVHEGRGIWSDLRHFIGRLGWYVKAVKVLLLGVKTFPQYIANAQVQVVEPNSLVDLPDGKHVTDLKGVVRRMLRADQTDLAEELTQALDETDHAMKVEEMFLRNYKAIQPRPHAELLILEHFHDQKLDFISGDKYIGCSKPSCYCCHLYMQHHPGDFTPRPGHGNVYINWAPPIPLPMIVQKAGGRGPHPRPQEHHTFKMLHLMLAEIRRELQEQILSRRPRRQKLPDSTTGMSSVLLDIETAMRNLVVDSTLLHADTSSFVPADSAESHPTIPELDFESDDAVKSHSASGSDDRFDDQIQSRIGKGTNRNLNSMHESRDAWRSESRTETSRFSSSTSESSSDTDDGGVLLFQGRKQQSPMPDPSGDTR